MLQANKATYEQLSTFDSIDQLNEAVRLHKNSHDLSATETAILDVLSRHSCVYKGVSFLAKGNIGKLIGKSRRTVIRVCQRLEERGIIRQYVMKRECGDQRQTSNAVVILTATENSSHVTPDMSHQEAQKPNKRNTYVLETANKRVVSDKHPASLRNSIPTPIYDALSPMFTAKELYEVYGVLLRAKASINRSIRAEEHTEFVDVFRACVRRYKSGQVRSLTSYLYAAWTKVSRGIYWREAAEEIYG